MKPYIFAFLLGWFGCWFLTRWQALWRRCCREHYKTHKTCRCLDCAWDRKCGGEEWQ